MLDLTKLNNNQNQAVKTTEGPLMVMAGAGSGKTRVLTYRIAYLIDELGVSPDAILAVTFTNKAAREMKERIEKLLDTDCKNMWISTFHSFGARFLRKEINALKDYNRLFNIIDDQDQERIVKRIIKDNDFDVSHKIVLSYISGIKSNEPMVIKNDNTLEQLERIYDIYQKELKKDNILDFDDLLYLTYKILANDDYLREKYQKKFDYILVDEFQDTNKIQFQLINLLTNDKQNIFVVGDINQSIYSFRGARIENINKFRAHYKDKLQLIKLEDNYRSTKEILDVANAVIKANNSFVDMNLKTDKSTGLKPKIVETDSNYGEVIFVINEIKKLLNEGYEYKDFAVLYRINSLSLNFETEFIKQNIPFIIYGGLSYFERREVKDIIAYLRLLINKDDDFSLKRIINVPKRKIGDKVLEKLNEKSNQKNLSLYNAIDDDFGSNVLSFKKIIDELSLEVNKVNLITLIEDILNKTGYLDELKRQEEDDRIDNVMELKTIMKDLMEENEGKDNKNILEEFLLDLSLRTDVDNIKENDNVVKLMSFHQAKGLEYKVVFMVAMEQGIFPSYHAISENRELEEERRICYVGITRAKERLYLSLARYRRLYGQDYTAVKSMFLGEIPSNLLAYKGQDNNPYMQKKKKTIMDDDIFSSEIEVGDKILHKAFGEGLVVSREDDIITVAFKVPYGIKKLLRNHPAITKIN